MTTSQKKSRVRRITWGGSQVRVSPRSDGSWAVKRISKSRNSAVSSTKSEAVKKAKEIAKNNKLELFIQWKDGRIQDRKSYGKDPFPPRG